MPEQRAQWEGLPVPKQTSGRSQRAENEGVALARFAPADARALRQLYRRLAELSSVFAGDPAQSSASAVRRWLQDHPDWLAETHGVARQLGAGEHGDRTTRQVLHDVCGAALPGLLVLLDWVRQGLDERVDVVRVALLLQDQRKLMRVMTPELDPDLHRRDMERRDHHSRLLGKWCDASWPVGDRVVEVECTIVDDLAVATCCSEFAALDRVVYNLVANAVRFAAGDDVRMRAEGVGPEKGHLRVSVTNRVSSDHQQWLQRTVEAPSALFLGGITRGGHGLGMQIAAELIANAYGLVDAKDVVEQGHVGVLLDRGLFTAYIHWPTV